MFNIIIVGLGGFVGAASRYSLALLNNRVFPNLIFPVNTLAVNVIGAFIIGFAAEYFAKNETMASSIQNSMQLFIMVGVLGGFTTFSAFSLETMNLFASGKTTLVVLNIILNVALCFTGVYLGRMAICRFL